MVELQEPIQLGQRVASYQVEAQVDGDWTTLHRGTTIGHKWMVRLSEPVTARRVRIAIEEARAVPLLAEVALYVDARE